MKKFSYFFILFLLFCFQHVYAENSSLSVGDKVCVANEYGKWFEGKITEIIDNSTMVKVKYSRYDTCFLCDNFEFNEDDYNDSFYEGWFDSAGASFRLPYVPKAGEEVLVEAKVYFTKPYYYTAKVESKYDNKYFSKYIVKFNNYTSNNTDTDTEDILACRIFKLPQLGDYLWADDLYAQVKERVDTDLWKVIEAGYTSTDRWVEKEQEVKPGNFKPAVGEDLKEIEYNFKIHEPIPVPQTREIFEFNAKSYPYSVDDSNIPDKFYPISFGGINYGLDEFWLELKWPKFKSPVDIYLVIVYESLKGDKAIFTVWSDRKIHSLDEGLQPFKAAPNYNNTSLWYTYPDKPLTYSLFPDGKYTFYLFVTPHGDISSFYAWKTELNKNWPGKYSNEIHNCTTDLYSDIDTIINYIEKNETTDIYNKLKSYVENYTSSSSTEDSKLEAYNNIMVTSYFADNVYPFCWAALNAFKYDNTKTTIMNSAIVCLLELKKEELAAKMLDCAYNKDPDFSVTHQNASVYFKMKNNLKEALNEKIKSVELAPYNYHNAWDGGYFVETHENEFSNFSSISDYFYDRVASNYPLLSYKGFPGKAPPETIVCCNCNGGIYHDIMNCLDSCEVTLACFTHICTPKLECCNGNGPFDFGAGICIPPEGVQLCVGIDAQGNITLSAGAGVLGGLIGGQVGLKVGFSGNYTIFTKASVGEALSASTVLITSDPKTKQWASTFSIGSDTKFDSGFTLGSNFNLPESWKKSIWCEFFSD